jgi:hypothetical protein
MLCIYNSKAILRAKPVTRSVCEDKPIFHANYIDNITYADIEDAIAASNHMKPCQRKQYFYSLGINLEHVSKYYNTIQVLEKQFIVPKKQIPDYHYTMVTVLHSILASIMHGLNIALSLIAFIFAEL